MSAVDEVLAAIHGRSPNPQGWVRACCPFCVLVVGKEDRKYSLGYNTTTKGWHCFRCGEKGRLPGGESHVPPPTNEARKVETIEPPPGFIALGADPGRSAFVTKPFRDYLASRAVSETVQQEAEIGACVGGRFANRVVIPVRTPDGRWLGFVARHIDRRHPIRYLNSSGAIPGLFNEAALYVETRTPVMVVEGCFDALPYWPNAVALMGKPSALQLTMLGQACRPVVVVLDGDAWREGEALAWSLGVEGIDARSVHLPPTMDPGEVDSHALWEQVTGAVG